MVFFSHAASWRRGAKNPTIPAVQIPGTTSIGEGRMQRTAPVP
jgi:hypothetical protein